MSRKYAAIIKLANNPDGSAKCLKYRFDNLTKFIGFWIRNGHNGSGLIYTLTKGQTRELKLGTTRSTNDLKEK